MTEKLIDCTRCGSNACSEMSNGKVIIWVCMGCGFTSNNTITDENVEQMEFTLPELYKALRFKDNFRIVSFTLDPLTDTPQRLSAYANQAKADPYKWLFLTADNQKTQELVQKGFVLPSVESEKADGDIVHSSKLVLVDGGGRVRGYYDSLESSQMKQLLKDAKGLIRGTF